MCQSQQLTSEQTKIISGKLNPTHNDNKDLEGKNQEGKYRRRLTHLSCFFFAAESDMYASLPNPQ